MACESRVSRPRLLYSAYCSFSLADASFGAVFIALIDIECHVNTPQYVNYEQSISNKNYRIYLQGYMNLWDR